MRVIRIKARFRKISNSKECWQEMVLCQSSVTVLENMSGYLQVTEWFQYTGMTDHNGIEICEGDIVRNFWTCKYKECGNPPIYKVIFTKGSFCYEGIADNIRFISNQYNPAELTKPSNWEVIGNIYENNDLLTER